MLQYSTLEKLGLIFAVVLIYYIVKILLSTIYTYVIGPVVNKVDFKSKGKWAMITGSTDGIGKEYAKHLAAEGCNIVLVSRSMDKLRDTAELIEKEYKVETKIIQVDFSGGKEIYEKIKQEIFGLEIGTLVNNVGISYNYPEYFLDVPDWDITMNNLLNTNIISVTHTTAIVLPEMVKRGKGVVINISSLSALISSPLLTVYAATKSFVDKFSENLEVEYKKNGIIVQCVFPGFVCSNMSKIRKSSLLIPSAKGFVRSAISLVGTTTKTTGYFPHTIMMAVVNGLRSLSKNSSDWLVVRKMETSKAKFLKKYKKQ